MKAKKKRYYRGKRSSKGELAIATFLDKHKISFQREKTFDECRSPKNRLLRFDFYIPCKNILIEYQGQHHYFPVNKYKRAQTTHNKTKKHDEIKRNFIEQENITLIEICYKDYKNIDDILEKQLLIILNEEE